MPAVNAIEQRRSGAPYPYEIFCSDPLPPQTRPETSRDAVHAVAAPASPYATFAAEASASQPASPRRQSRRSSISPAVAAGGAASPYAAFAAAGVSPQPWPQPRSRSDGEGAARGPVSRQPEAIAAPPAVALPGRGSMGRGSRLVDPVLASLVHEDPPDAEVRGRHWAS